MEEGWTSNHFNKICLDTHYLSRYLKQKTANWPFRFSSQATTCYYQSTQR